MEVKLMLVLVLFPCLWLADGCERKTTNNNYCSGHAKCIIIYRCARSLDNNEKGHKIRTYRITLQGDPCNFSTYDNNGDGVITKEEMQVILCSTVETDALFADLDILEGDGEIMSEEFNATAPQIITNCFEDQQLLE
ncbi:uncharacterized protein LOC123543953 [Mercenaria mercenaria]|uniref:uncharacterized protein LOC123543953 n=1 Tax=Mercenaria mercenaria TaxID=6596 RepID=UPI00234EF007|nr:uncharacterized protein LOC123543953 [Mercenaria mercenaria]